MISSSSSNWLDRLRSSRGFPTGEEPDLDRFISSSSSGSAESDATRCFVVKQKPTKWAPPPGEFSGVLCDLFNMGGGEEGSRSFPKKKASRKQANPKFFCGDFLPSSSSDNNYKSLNDLQHNNNSNNTSNNSYGNDNNDGDFRVVVEDELKLRAVDEDKDDDDGVDLKAYTRSEVTVIDTSFEEWKSDKWVFRKNDEWRIKEKKSNKGKSRVFSGGAGKKKKLLEDQNLDVVDDDGGDDNQLMKKKMEDLSSLHPNKGRPRKVKEREPFRERKQFVGKVPQKRFPCPRPPEKSKNEASPVVLIKSIPLNDTNPADKISKTSHKKRPKQMKIV